MRPVVVAFFLLGAAFVPEVAMAQESANDVVAVVLGEEIHRGSAPEIDGRQLMGIVLESLMQHYAAENGLEPTEDEIDALLAAVPAPPGDGETSVGDRREDARPFVESFKVNQSLYERYGGRVAFQQFGPEPIDAYRAFLEEQQEAGAFRILYADLVAGFWEYLTDDSMHSFYSTEEGKAVMSAPWWLEKPSE
jgi:hypothetical protein